MLREARLVGLNVRREGHALIVRGQERQGGLARDILSHKALMLAALEREDEYRSHERAEHDDESVDWRQGEDGRLVCSVCQPPLIPELDADPTGVVRAVMAAADQAVPAIEATAALRACPTCGSTGRCEGRLPTADGGWVCRAALAMGLVRVNGQRSKANRSGPRPA
jgi:hypothetical protein